jgi:hypothetical protein
MIQLATDPTASRMSYRPVQGEDEAKEPRLEHRRGRSGHAWPFLSRYATQPVRENSQQSTDTQSNS